MRDPKEVYTESGYRDHIRRLENIEEQLFFILNDADDLHINDEDLEVLYAFQRLIEGDTAILKTGDGEKMDDD